MANDGTAGDLALWEGEMAQHLVHERRRLHLVAAVLVVIGAVLLAGHVLDDGQGRSLIPWGLDDLIAGYLGEMAIAVAAGATLVRAHVVTRSRRWSSGGRIFLSRRLNET